MIQQHGGFCDRSHHIRCGHCHGTHHTTAQVQVCGTGHYTDPDTGTTMQAWPCQWLVEHTGDDGWPAAHDCGHPAYATATGHTCAAGHEHVTAEIRHAQGWDYADTDEAPALAAAGTRPVQMDGKPYIFAC